MVERRKPLVLASTKYLVNSVLSNAKSRLDEGDRPSSSGNLVLPHVELRAGILRFSVDKRELSDPKLASLDDSALVGLSVIALKRLSVTSGSLVIVTNPDTRLKRTGHVVALDPPIVSEGASVLNAPFSGSARVMHLFPSVSFPQDDNVLLDHEVAYLSPLLAFNLNLHKTCLKFLVNQGKETLASLFEAGAEDKAPSNSPFISLKLELLSQLPVYASHVRVSFVKIPDCGTLEGLKGSSSIEAEERQEMIDVALHDYFRVDRFLSKGDIFSIVIQWNCNSFTCIPCSQRLQNNNNSVIYFKVVAMEPSNKQVLGVNRTRTALVLGGSVSSAVPPDILVTRPKGLPPLHGDVVNILGSILAPALCPSLLSSKFRVAVLLYGLRGCGKSTVVKYVAKRLGLHVVELSCHNLVASSEKKTSAAIIQAFNTAKRYSPSILLLRHFDVFRNLTSHEGSSTDHIGISSEVASVIREFTEPVSAEYIEADSNGDLKVNPKNVFALIQKEGGLGGSRVKRFWPGQVAGRTGFRAYARHFPQLPLFPQQPKHGQQSDAFFLSAFKLHFHGSVSCSLASISSTFCLWSCISQIQLDWSVNGEPRSVVHHLRPPRSPGPRAILLTQGWVQLNVWPPSANLVN